MKKALSLLLTFLLFFCVAGPSLAAGDAETLLASGGRTDYVIVVGENASATERTAADTLADYLGRITGADFPVVTDAESPHDKEIVVGVTNRDAEAGIDRTGYDEDTVRIVTRGKKLFLTGGEKRGAIYAVYTYLEDRLGCRWFTHELTVTPENAAPALGAIDYTYTPPFKLRQTYWMFSTMYPDYCVSHKLHGIMAYVPDEMGGGRWDMVINSVHTMSSIIPYSLFDEHPEYFGMDDNGNRTTSRQPCFSNPDVLRLTIAYALNFCAQYDTILSVSQNDGADFCRCPECVAYNKAHGGTDAASLLNFVNKVAAAVDEAYPGRRIETLAYQNSQTPPTGLRAADNVVVRLCSIYTCVLHDLTDRKCDSNKKFSDDLNAWKIVADNLYIWDYSTNFQYYYALYPNLTHLQSRYQYFRDCGVDAVFDHGCGDVTVAGEFHELRTYLVCRLLWNPDTDIERDIAEFCAAYYGAAADDVIEFIKQFETRVQGYNPLSVKTSHVSCSDGGENLEANTSLTETDIRKLDALLADAAAKPLNEDEARHLEGLTISWRFFKCATFAGEFNWLSYKNDPEEEARKLYHDMKDYGITCLSEAWGLYLHDEEPNCKVRPTFWYMDESELPSSVKTQAKILPVINRLLRMLFFVPRMFEGMV